MKSIRQHELGVFPIVQHYIKQLGIYELFIEHLPLVNGEPSHARCLSVLIRYQSG